MRVKRFKFRPIGIVVASFVIVIFAGAGLLCLPFAVRSGEPDFLIALFSATSATCVTGHTVIDPYTYFTGFGQAVMLVLIQIGGLGFITIISLFMLYIKKDVTLSDRKLAMQSAGGLKMAGLKGLLKYIFIGTFSLEFLGAVLLAISFVPDYGWGLGIWQAVFTSVSSFCNAGFSLTGAGGDLSLAGYNSDPLFLIVVMALIAIGGLGFYVWYDVIKGRFRPSRYSLHTKVVLISTGAILLLAWALFMAFEWNNDGTIGKMNAGDKVLNCLFFAVTPRTAGHYTVDMNYFSDGAYILTNVLMFVGGSPGSTAGGIKTTTIAVLIMSAISTSRRRTEAHIFKRRFEDDALPQAGTVFFIYLSMVILCSMIISAIEAQSGFTTHQIVFEVVSAIGTVGLSCGPDAANPTLTGLLSSGSQLILIFLMFLGRVGGFTLILVFTNERKPVTISRVPDSLIIG